MAIGKGKRRYSVTLTPANVDRFKAACAKLGLPESTLSRCCDDIIRDTCGIFEEAIRKGNIGIEDLFRVMGQQMELIIQEERKEAENARSARSGSSRKR